MESWCSYLLFFAVILFSNIIQGITGFAGTVLALPVSLMLVGYSVARPVLNVLGVLSGEYVFFKNRESLNKKELLKICAVMTCGILLGILLKRYTVGREKWLYFSLGLFIIFLSVERMIRLFIHPKRVALKNDGTVRASPQKIPHPVLSALSDYTILICAGLVHGIFVCGGPLLICYLSKKLDDSREFRTTISMVWIFLNTFIFITDIAQGYWNSALFKILAISLPFLWGGMKLGSILYAHMNQKIFITLTYILLLISGISLAVK